jgi:hypothetical protein
MSEVWIASDDVTYRLTTAASTVSSNLADSFSYKTVQCSLDFPSGQTDINFHLLYEDDLAVPVFQMALGIIGTSLTGGISLVCWIGLVLLIRRSDYHLKLQHQGMVVMSHLGSSLMIITPVRSLTGYDFPCSVTFWLNGLSLSILGASVCVILFRFAILHELQLVKRQALAPTAASMPNSALATNAATHTGGSQINHASQRDSKTAKSSGNKQASQQASPMKPLPLPPSPVDEARIKRQIASLLVRQESPFAWKLFSLLLLPALLMLVLMFSLREGDLNVGHDCRDHLMNNLIVGLSALLYSLLLVYFNVQAWKSNDAFGIRRKLFVFSVIFFLASLVFIILQLASPEWKPSSFDYHYFLWAIGLVYQVRMLFVPFLENGRLCSCCGGKEHGVGEYTAEETLEDVLATNLGFGYFLKYCSFEFNDEAALCYRAIDNFKKHTTIAAFLNIMNKFIKKGAPLRVSSLLVSSWIFCDVALASRPCSMLPIASVLFRLMFRLLPSPPFWPKRPISFLARFTLCKTKTSSTRSRRNSSR